MPRELTDWPGTETDARISPGGRTIAFDADVEVVTVAHDPGDLDECGLRVALTAATLGCAS